MNKEQNNTDNFSQDKLITDSIKSLISLLDKLHIIYVMLGSIGIQSYLDYFIRLPKDIDILILKKDLKILIEYCKKEKLKIIKKPGRVKLITENIMIHIIPDEMSIEDRVSKEIFAKIQLSQYLHNPETRNIKLFYCDNTILINVLPVEICLFLELNRPANTNILITIYNVLRKNDVNKKIFASFLKENRVFEDIVLSNLHQYETMIKLLTCDSAKNILTVKTKINQIYDYTLTELNS